MPFVYCFNMGRMLTPPNQIKARALYTLPVRTDKYEMSVEGDILRRVWSSVCYVQETLGEHAHASFTKLRVSFSP